MPLTGSFKKNIFPIFLIGVIAYLLYHPILNNTFLADDYYSLYRISIEKRILYKEFFRPMIDISFSLNYFISGMNSNSYYIFNLLVHIFNTYLLYLFARQFILTDDNRGEVFAIVSAFLFLIYPFHNEGIVWLTGRLSTLACFFSLICLNISLRNRNNTFKLSLSAIFFLIGLISYEAILFLPAIIIAITWQKEKPVKEIITSAIFWTIITGFYLFVRFYFSNKIYGEYGGRIFDGGITGQLSKLFKVSGRMFLPPIENSTHMTVFFIILSSILIFVHIWIFRKRAIKNSLPIKYLQLIIALIIALIIPVCFGISTRTFEADRLLYFPSCFLCMIISYFFIYLIQWRVAKIVSLSIISIYFIFFLEKNNRQWVKASDASKLILQTVKENASKGIVLINMPDELEGAVVFRNGFRESLVLNHIDTSKVIVTNLLTRLEYLKIGDTIQPVRQNGGLFIYPVTLLQESNNQNIQIVNLSTGAVPREVTRAYSFYYWNKSNLVKLF